MKVNPIKSAWFWVAALLLMAALGLFGYTLYLRHAVDQLFRDSLEVNRELVSLLKAVHADEDLEPTWLKILAKHEQLKALAQRARSLPRPSAQLDEEMRERYHPQLKALLEQYKQETKRIRDQIPGGPAFCEKLENTWPSPGWTFVEQGPTP